MTAFRLSPKAARDVVLLLVDSRSRWGDLVARRTRKRLIARFSAIASGAAQGHRRSDVPDHLPLRFVLEPPFVIAFHAETREIIRVFHGRRDIGVTLVEDEG
ncbi:type II toxin-antitoxin system RelE/ParE family toxin [Azospirillum rugosum]|uniref:Plasmid stabilization system protein ParE n=1 Tax=Azospirillum rugosum TaxID=416170 RepID=A0ABS4SCU1_9PROT|nr:type II toxin-antitoxin system RelE/ParE family toxin [Azospirillum rugosum]MBP2290383.1 plasmid stabilization system protein ParE [Azospirillum rugosum]MDQ0527859.1 plasmid stabilization system protein ParE [Azospirillum rugosum]